MTEEELKAYIEKANQDRENAKKQDEEGVVDMPRELKVEWIDGEEVNNG